MAENTTAAGQSSSAYRLPDFQHPRDKQGDKLMPAPVRAAFLSQAEIEDDYTVRPTGSQALMGSLEQERFISRISGNQVNPFQGNLYAFNDDQANFIVNTTKTASKTAMKGIGLAVASRLPGVRGALSWAGRGMQTAPGMRMAGGIVGLVGADIMLAEGLAGVFSDWHSPSEWSATKQEREEKLSKELGYSTKPWWVASQNQWWDMKRNSPEGPWDGSFPRQPRDPAKMISQLDERSHFETMINATEGLGFRPPQGQEWWRENHNLYDQLTRHIEDFSDETGMSIRGTDMQKQMGQKIYWDRGNPFNLKEYHHDVPGYESDEEEEGGRQARVSSSYNEYANSYQPESNLLSRR